MKLRRKNGQQRVVMYSSAWAICPQWQQAAMVLNMTVTGLYIAHCKCANALRRRSQSVDVSWDTSSAIVTVYSLHTRHAYMPYTV
jgi:hypothetical protein